MVDATISPVTDAASLLPPPAIVQPAPREVSFGAVAGWAPAGTTRIVVRIDGRKAADRKLVGRHFSLQVALPARDAAVTVTAHADGGRRSSATVAEVYGLPAAARPTGAAAHEDALLAQTVRRLAAGFHGTTGVYVEDLRTGSGAAWNARARFPAGSTLKLAIAVTVLSRLEGKPAAGSRIDSLMSSMLTISDNEAANALETWLAGSTSAGSAVVNEVMTALGLRDSLMYGGYARSLAAVRRPIPLRIESAPAFGLGKYSTAADLSRLARLVYLRAAGRGPGLHPSVTGLTPADARHLLWRLARVRDHGKLDRFVEGTALHKAGWLATARHDNGIVVWGGGVFVATVMTWNGGGVGSASDVLAGRVAEAARLRFG